MGELVLELWLQADWAGLACSTHKCELGLSVGKASPWLKHSMSKAKRFLFYFIFLFSSLKHFLIEFFTDSYIIQ